MITLFRDATYCLVRSTTEDDKHLTIMYRVRMALEKTKFYLAEMSQKVRSVHHENLQDGDFIWRESILPFESANY